MYIIYKIIPLETRITFKSIINPIKGLKDITKAKLSPREGLSLRHRKLEFPLSVEVSFLHTMKI